MKMWKATIKGAKRFPKGVGQLFDGNRTCALGAALHGNKQFISANLWEHNITDVYKNFPISLSVADRPLKHEGTYKISHIIYSLNDIYMSGAVKP